MPVWFMRQAGRSLPEYRKARSGTAMLDACLDPDLVAEITCQPVRRHGVDAGIFFSDIMVPLKLAGADVEITPGIGPVFSSPVRSRADVDALTSRQIDSIDVIVEAARTCCTELDGTATPLIGFAGAPFTIAAYAAEGRGSRDHLAARALMHSDPEAWHRLAAWAADLAIAFLRAQVEGGARAVQLFDSWAGALSRSDYRTFCLPHSRRVLQTLRADGVPTIHFGTGTAHLLVDMRDAGATCVGVDYRTPLDEAATLLRSDNQVNHSCGPVILQGNIDPALLACPRDALHAHTRDVIERGRRADAHIVNLGHGVPPTTDPQVLTDLVAFIHDLPAGTLASLEGM